MRRGMMWGGGAVAAALAVTLLGWWLPARAPSGYYIPMTRGIVSGLPPQVSLIWVRPTPWATSAPPITMTLTMRGAQPIKDYYERPAPVALWAPRAVMVTVDFYQVQPFPRTGQIASLTVTWPGGRARRVFHHLWAVHASDVMSGPGLGKGGPVFVGSTTLHPGASGAATWADVLMLKVTGDVVGVSSPNPGSGPWVRPRCAMVPNLTAATTGSFGHLREVAGRLTASACASLRGAALVEGSTPAALPIAYLYDEMIRMRTPRGTFVWDSGAGYSGEGIPFTAFNWWRFIRS